MVRESQTLVSDDFDNDEESWSCIMYIYCAYLLEFFLCFSQITKAMGLGEGYHEDKASLC